MSELRVDPMFRPDQSAVVQLVDEQLAVVQRPLTIEESVSFDVGEGSYLLRALWSDGRKTQQVIEVPSAGTSVALTAPTLELARDDVSYDPTSPRAIIYSATRNSSLTTDSLWGAPPPRRRGGPPVDETAILEREKIERDLKETGMVLQGPSAPSPRLWRRTNGEWEERPIDVHPETVPGGIDLRLTVGDSLHLIEIGSGRARQFLALPAEESTVSIRTFLADSVFYTGTEICNEDKDTKALQGYIQNGEIAVARTVAPEVMAERFMRAKVAAPRIAALGAYFLLRVGDLERLHDWPDNLTNWKTWLPDGPVIAAWQRLRSNNPNYEEAFELLMEATHRGLPVYTEGVRLLKDGLDLFANDDEKDWDVTDALAEIDRFGKAMNWGKPETTYFGDAPDQPRLGARLG